MSIDYIVICDRSLPSDWTDDFRTAGLPFDFWVESYTSWKSEFEDWLAGEPQDEFVVELGRRLRREWGFVGRFNCRPAAAELVELCVEDLIKSFGGFYFDDHSYELSPVRESVTPTTGARVVESWRQLLGDEEARERRAQEIAKREWEAEAESDPEGVAKANDWSDVL